MSREKADLISFPQPAERGAILERKRIEKMARSAHAYVRGSTALFYEWLAGCGEHAVPAGPAIWIGGDCHVGNLGPLANADGEVRIQIRDLDQAVIGNPAHDVIRLALSLATAARGSDLPGLVTVHMVEEIARGYADALLGHDETLSEAQAGEAVRAVLDQATRRRWEHLARERLDQIEPALPLGKRFWPLSEEERGAIESIVTSEATAALIATLHDRDRTPALKLIDAAYWMKGCSSLGSLRFAVLIRLGDDRKRSYHLLDIKEAVRSVAPAAAQDSPPLDHAMRVVSGARALSPYLGDRMVPTRLLGRPVVVRELMPQDLKLAIDQLSREEAVQAARFLAAVVGHAHARQLPRGERLRWAEEVGARRAPGLDAPSWLWSAVVALMAHHEQAYLDHCRAFAAAG